MAQVIQMHIAMLSKESTELAEQIQARHFQRHLQIFAAMVRRQEFPQALILGHGHVMD